MSELPLTCWSCGSALPNVPLPIGRREECPKCTASLHVCRQCVHYDRNANKSCREPVADEVVDKEGANFCDYYQPRFGLAAGGDDAAAQARAKLAQAFGGGTAGPSSVRPGAPRGSVSGADEAKRKLEEMFGKKK
jgi:hypothetical protein